MSKPERSAMVHQVAQIYQIKIQGELGGNWSDWFNGMTISVEDNLPITTLTGIVADQAALRGILNKLWDLNLTLISVRRIETDDKEECKND
jgi:hypothetical protein